MNTTTCTGTSFTCASGFIQTNTACLKCQPNEYILNSVCTNCPANAVCTGGSSFTCQTGYQLFNGACVPISATPTSQPAPGNSDFITWFQNNLIGSISVLAGGVVVLGAIAISIGLILRRRFARSILSTTKTRVSTISQSVTGTGILPTSTSASFMPSSPSMSLSPSISMSPSQMQMYQTQSRMSAGPSQMMMTNQSLGRMTASPSQMMMNSSPSMTMNGTTIYQTPQTIRAEAALGMQPGSVYLQPVNQSLNRKPQK